MTFDAKIYRVCDHRILEEWYKIDPQDMVTLKYTGESNIFLSRTVSDELHFFGETQNLGSNSFLLSNPQVQLETVSLKTIGDFPIVFTKDIDFSVEIYNTESEPELQKAKINRLPRKADQSTNEFVGILSSKTNYLLLNKRVIFSSIHLYLDNLELAPTFVNDEDILKENFRLESNTQGPDSIVFSLELIQRFFPQPDPNNPDDPRRRIQLPGYDGDDGIVTNPPVIRIDYIFANIGIQEFESVKATYSFLENTSVTRIFRPIVSQNVELFLNGYPIPKNDPLHGWLITLDETSAVEDPKLKIVFKKPLKNFDDIITINYQTNSRNCPKCLNEKILNDLSYDSMGTLITVTKESKLMQELLKGILTEIGSNVFHTWVGTSIPKMIGNKLNQTFVNTVLSKEISSFIRNYMEVQIQAGKFQAQDPEEEVNYLNSVKVTQSTIDPTFISVLIVVTNKAGIQVELNEALKIDTNIATIKKSLNNVKPTNFLTRG